MVFVFFGAEWSNEVTLIRQTRRAEHETRQSGDLKIDILEEVSLENPRQQPSSKIKIYDNTLYVWQIYHVIHNILYLVCCVLLSIYILENLERLHKTCITGQYGLENANQSSFEACLSGFNSTIPCGAYIILAAAPTATRWKPETTDGNCSPACHSRCDLFERSHGNGVHEHGRALHNRRSGEFPQQVIREVYEYAVQPLLR